MPQIEMSGAAARLLVALLVGEGPELKRLVEKVGMSERSLFRAQEELRRLGWIRKGSRVTTLALEDRVLGVSSSGSANMNKDILYYTDQTENPPSSAPPPLIPGTVTTPQQPSVGPLTDNHGSPTDTVGSRGDTVGSETDTVGSDPLDALLEADDLPAGDFSMRPGSPFVLKRKAQTKALQTLWHGLFPTFPVLSSGNAGILIKMAEESSYLVGVCLQDTAEKGERITAPFGYVKAAIGSAVKAGWMKPSKSSSAASDDDDDLPEATPEYLARLRAVQDRAKDMWGDDDE